MRSWLMVKYAEGISSVNLGEGSGLSEASPKEPEPHNACYVLYIKQDRRVRRS